MTRWHHTGADPRPLDAPAQFRRLATSGQRRYVERVRTGDTRLQLFRLCIVATIALASHAAEASGIGDFAGTWQGKTVEAPAGATFQPGDFDSGITVEADGFTLRYRPLGGEPVDARFYAQAEPGVYGVEQSTGGVLGMFAKRRTGNPLAGETLRWARVAGDSLIVYALSLDPEGHLDLDRYQRQLLPDGGMRVAFQRITDGEPVAMATATLASGK
jgi:hypothetical protein